MTADRSEAPSGNEARIHPDVDRLLLDVMLGKLAVYLRASGYDAAYAGDRDVEADGRLLELANSEGRILLTRDVRLAERTDESILLSEREVGEQLAELREGGAALGLADPPGRCGRCNGRLDPVDRAAETPGYAPEPEETDSWRCRRCGQVFWKGSHWDRMGEQLSGGQGGDA